MPCKPEKHEEFKVMEYLRLNIVTEIQLTKVFTVFL